MLPNLDREAVNGDARRLTDSEQRVLAALSDRESSATHPRLASGYQRMIELARTGDPIDGILAAHLGREILSALPTALGVVLPRTRVVYENRLDTIAGMWPAEARGSEPPEPAIHAIKELLAEHEAASVRARHGPRELIANEDRGGSGFVPAPSLDSWTEVAHRGAGLAHRLRALELELPTADATTALADELTAMLLSLVAPYFEGIREIDRMLQLDRPTEGQTRQLIALLGTASTQQYFFERADERWLAPLSEIGGAAIGTFGTLARARAREAPILPTRARGCTCTATSVADYADRHRGALSVAVLTS